jgi:aminomethyltransferase
MRISRGPVTGLDLFVPVASLPVIAGKLVAAATERGGRACGWEALELTRIEAGIPRFGQDMAETNLASEAGIEERAISYTKGCYIGQEVISRIRAFGQVAKSLRGLRLDGPADALPQKGSKLIANEKEVGYITSAIFSPRLQANIALGYVRREHNQIGTELIVQSGEKRVSARVVALPFAAE